MKLTCLYDVLACRRLSSLVLELAQSCAHIPASPKACVSIASAPLDNSLSVHVQGLLLILAPIIY